MKNINDRLEKLQKHINDKDRVIKIVDYENGKYYYKGKEYKSDQLAQLKASADIIIIDNI